MVPKDFLAMIHHSLAPYWVYLGVIVFIFFAYGMFRNIKNRYVQISLIMMFLSFLFAILASMPQLSQLLYKLPLINSFRVPLRILFIYNFFALVIFAITLSRYADIKEFGRSIKALLPAFFVTLLIYFLSILSKKELLKLKIPAIAPYEDVFLLLSSILLIVLLLLYVFKALTNLFGKHKQIIFYFFVSICVIFNFLSTKEFNRIGSTPIGAYTNFSIEDQRIREFLGYGKYISFDSAQGLVFYDRNIMFKINSLNQYGALNNPNISKIMLDYYEPLINASGLLVRYPFSLFSIKNDFLSMIGVKIVNSPSLSLDNTSYSFGKNVIFLEEQTQDIRSKLHFADYGGNLCVSDIILGSSLKNKTIYELEFDFNKSADNLHSRFEVGINGEVVVYFDLQNDGFSHVSKLFFVNTETVPLKTAFRLVSNPCNSASFENIKISEIETTQDNSTYIPFESERKDLFINSKAKDILFSPRYVKNIDNITDLYVNFWKYDVLNTSYIATEGIGGGIVDIDISQVQSEIEIIKFTNNKIIAKINASDNTFVNFSQNHFPGWVGFVDGKKVPVYLVNGLILGMEVPKGEHIIEFRFTSFAFTIGAVITLFTFFVVVILLFRRRNKKV